MPSYFGIVKGHDLALCLKLSRWREIVGRAGARGLTAESVGVVPMSRC